MLLPFHGGCIMEQVLQQEETPFLVSGHIPAWVLSSQFTKIELTPEGLISHCLSSWSSGQFPLPSLLLL